MCFDLLSKLQPVTWGRYPLIPLPRSIERSWFRCLRPAHGSTSDAPRAQQKMVHGCPWMSVVGRLRGPRLEVGSFGSDIGSRCFEDFPPKKWIEMAWWSPAMPQCFRFGSPFVSSPVWALGQWLSCIGFQEEHGRETAGSEECSRRDRLKVSWNCVTNIRM